MSIEKIGEQVVRGREALNEAPVAAAEAAWDLLATQELRYAYSSIITTVREQLEVLNGVTQLTRDVREQGATAQTCFTLAAAGSDNADALEMIRGAQTVAERADLQDQSIKTMGALLVGMSELATKLIELIHAYDTQAGNSTRDARVISSAQPAAIENANAYLANLGYKQP